MSAYPDTSFLYAIYRKQTFKTSRNGYRRSIRWRAGIGHWIFSTWPPPCTWLRTSS